ncbi:MAG: transketolase family protein [Candidatus Aminicenantia bacterium]
MSKVVEKSLRDVYGETLVALGRKNPRIAVLDADLSGSTRTFLFAKEFPERFFNLGVSEQDLIGTAAGLALCRFIPFASTFAVFQTGRAWEQIRQSVCYARLNVKLIASHGGITVGEDGPTHHATEDIALMRVLPNMTVIVPADAVETKKVIEKIAEYDGPCYVRLARPKFPIIFDESYEFEIGKGKIVKDGSSVTIFAIGISLFHSLIASENLEKKGISVRVVNMSTVKPLDRELIVKCAKETGLIITVEDHSVIGGLGSAISEVLVEEYPVFQKTLGVPDKFTQSGKPDELLDKCGISSPHIEKAVVELLKKKISFHRNS